MRAALLGLSLLLLPGCFFRFSDPVYTFQGLRADAPPAPEYSLLVGTIEVEGGFLSASSVDTITFRRVEPEGETRYRVVSESRLFRAFQPRSMKDGTFVVALPPGVYELEELEETRFPFPSRWRMSESSRVSSRFYVTRPGVYDLGVLRIAQEEWGRYAIGRVAPLDSAARRKVLENALKGTGWDALLEQGPVRPPPTVKNPTLVQLLPGERR